MGNDLLKDELQRLQLEYRNILEHALKDIYKKDTDAIIDEVKVFWYRNKKLVQCILRYMYEPYSAYIFTAATILNIEDCEHYPFVSLGKYHFWDDPIYKYAEISREVGGTAFGQKMREQVISTIKDNIKILDKAEGIIYILPIRFLSNPDIDLVYKASEQCFLSLFKNKIDFDYYRENYKTISDVKNGLSPGIEKSIIFSEDDDSTLDFETRFSNYKESTVLPLPPDSTDAKIFWFCMYGYLSQAFDIMLVCIEYQLVPYIRFEVAFKYILKLSTNFGDSSELSEMLFKCGVAYILHHTFDKKKIQSIEFREYYQAISNFNFENQLFLDFHQEKISITNPSPGKMKSIIEKNLDEILAKCYSNKQ